MWSAGSKVVDVYLGVSEGGMRVPGRKPVWSAHTDIGEAAARWFAEARAARRARLRQPRVRVWLSSALARPFLWGPVQGLTRWREVQLAVQAAAPEATGLNAPCTVSLEEWPSPHPALAAAMQDSTAAAIISAAKSTRVQLASMRPWWAGVLEQAASTSVSALAAQDSDALTVLVATEEAWSIAHSYWPRPAAHDAGPLLDRLMLSTTIPPEAVRRVELAPDMDGGLWPGLVEGK